MKCSKCGAECRTFRPMLENQVGKVVCSKCENLEEDKKEVINK